MSNLTPCPSSADLQHYLLGQIPDASASAIDAHLETCAVCLQALGGPSPGDPLLDVMQASGRMRRPRNQFVDGLVQKLAGFSRTLLPSRLAQQLETPSQSAALGETIPTVTPASIQATCAADEMGRPPDNPKDYLAPAQAPDEMGRLGGYRVLKVLGSGGMGVVFLAEDVNLKRRIALKVMRPSIAASAEARQRFIKEAQATAAIEHEHIIAIHQVHEERGVPFLAMPLLQGETLEDRLMREKTLPLAEAVRIAREIAEGLAAAHDKGLIHRDIKPVNVWLTQDGRVKVLDFGLARSLEGDMNLTQTGAIVGTPAYMAPEQARGETVDGRSDLFSLGCVLYRMLTGERPFKGATPMSQLRSLEMDQPQAPQQVNPQVPPSLSDFVQRLLAKNPAERLASARQAATALHAIENEQHGVQQDATYPVAIPMPAPDKDWSAILKIPAHWKKRLFTWQMTAVAAGVLVFALTGLSLGVFALLHGKTKPIEVAVVPPPPGGPESREEQQRKGFESIIRPVDTTTTGQPLAFGSLVTAPAVIDNVDRWTIETDKYSAPPGWISFLANGRVMDFSWGSHRHFSLEKYDFIDPPVRGNYYSLSPDNARWLRIEGQKLAIGLTADEKEPQYILGFPAGIMMAAWHPDGKTIAVMGADGKLTLCDGVAAGKLADREWNRGGDYSVLTWAPDGKTIAHYKNAVAGVTFCQLINPETGEVFKTINIPEVTSTVQWSPDSSMLAIRGSSTVYVWQIDPLKSVWSFKSDTTPIWRHDSKAMAYALGKTARIRKVKQDQDVQTFTGHKDPISAVQFSPDSKTIITISPADWTVRFWEAATGKHRGTIVYLTTQRALVLSPSGHYTGSSGVEGDFLFEYQLQGEKVHHHLTPEQFRKKFNWTNDPTRVSLFAQ